MKAAIGEIHFHGRDRLHRQALLAEVEDHASGDAVETGEDRAIHFMPHATASFSEHSATCNSCLGCSLMHEIIPSKSDRKDGHTSEACDPGGERLWKLICPDHRMKRMRWEVIDGVRGTTPRIFAVAFVDSGRNNSRWNQGSWIQQDFRACPKEPVVGVCVLFTDAQPARTRMDHDCAR